ncbi:MAG: aldo/keto reductase [Imperialibacter sp.]|uniref:aldo/keto reductase n=1 Tax=Imperialibacter sp. TaxID=2038411 RepID=UPI0032EE2DF8
MTITDIRGTVKLNNGIQMPYFGLGVFKTKDGKEVVDSINHAVEAGYRLIDTAALYGNERGVGDAVRALGIPRKDIFVTSKVWNSEQGYEPTLKAFDHSIKRLGLDYVDLFLIHWPVKGKYKETWRALEKLLNEGYIRSIGVSNFLQHHLEDLMTSSSTVPAVNQIEFHPHLVQQNLLDFCADKNIQVEAWSPLMQGGVFKIDALKQLAEKYNKTIAQVVLRWNLQKGVATIPKSVTPARISENAAIFDFNIGPEDMVVIDHLDMHHRVGADPDNFSF